MCALYASPCLSVLICNKFRKGLSTQLREEVISAKKKIGGGAVTIGKHLRVKRKMKVDNNRIHAILLGENMAKEEPGKKGRKKWG